LTFITVLFCTTGNNRLVGLFVFWIALVLIIKLIIFNKELIGWPSDFPARLKCTCVHCKKSRPLQLDCFSLLLRNTHCNKNNIIQSEISRRRQSSTLRNPIIRSLCNVKGIFGRMVYQIIIDGRTASAFDIFRLSDSQFSTCL
jgi:hypothetical protein